MINDFINDVIDSTFDRNLHYFIEIKLLYQNYLFSNDNEHGGFKLDYLYVIVSVISSINFKKRIYSVFFYEFFYSALKNVK
jgi:hypothetical protein